MPVAQLLEAADALFARADAPQTVTMEAIAVAAGVGKATLFRAFGSRDGLLDALWAARLAPLQAAVEGAEAPLGTGAPPGPRATAFMDALLSFKLANRHLLRAREIAPGLLQSDRYRWMHAQLRGCLMQAAPAAGAELAIPMAHGLLASLHIDLIEVMLAQGLTQETIRRAQALQVWGAIEALRHGAGSAMA